jgi:hypothetical protein
MRTFAMAIGVLRIHHSISKCSIKDFQYYMFTWAKGTWAMGELSVLSLLLRPKINWPIAHLPCTHANFRYGNWSIENSPFDFKMFNQRFSILHVHMGDGHMGDGRIIGSFATASPKNQLAPRPSPIAHENIRYSKWKIENSPFDFKMFNQRFSILHVHKGDGPMGDGRTFSDPNQRFVLLLLPFYER